MNCATKLSKNLKAILSHNELKILIKKYSNPYEKYQNDPIGFSEKILGNSFTDDIKKLCNSVRDHQITIAKSCNAVGKTHAAAAIAIWFYKSFIGSQVYTCAYPEPKLKQLLWGEIDKILINNQELFAADQCNILNIKCKGNSFITGVTVPNSGTEAQKEARFSGKHAPHLMFIIDEGDTIPDEVYRGIESCMSGGHFRLLVLFNPREERGPVYRMERDGIANVIELKAFNHPNVIEGKNIIPGAVDRNTTARRINLWARPLMAEEIKGSECFELPDFMIGVQAKDQKGKILPPLKAGTYKITSPELSYMVLAQYPAQSVYSLINRYDINLARSRWDQYVSTYGELPPKLTNPILGLDVAEFGIDTNVACLRYGNWVPIMETWKGIDTIATGKKAYRIYKDNNCCTANIDGTGVGAGVAPHMNDIGETNNEIVYANSIKVASSPTEATEEGLEFVTLRDQLWWKCAEWLKTEQAMLPPNELLIEELLVAKRETSKNKIKIMDKKTMRELLKRSPDYADALCLTFAPQEIIDDGIISGDSAYSE